MSVRDGTLKQITSIEMGVLQVEVKYQVELPSLLSKFLFWNFQMRYHASFSSRSSKTTRVQSLRIQKSSCCVKFYLIKWSRKPNILDFLGISNLCLWQNFNSFSCQFSFLVVHLKVLSNLKVWSNRCLLSKERSFTFKLFFFH